jgi:peptide/nickel transport system substrate-binding protein
VLAVVIIVLVIIGGVVALQLSMSRNTSSVSTNSESSSSTSSLYQTSENQTTSSKTLQNQSLTLDDSAWPTEGVSPSPITSSGNYPNWPVGPVWQTLVNFNLDAEQEQGVFQIVPDLATNWTVSSNAETYTFQLRQGVTFSNGDPFNAYVVWTNFYLYSYETYNSSTFWAYLPLFNFSSINFGPATMAVINSSGLSSPSSQLESLMSNSSWPVYVNGSSSIVFQLVSPYSFFLNTFADFSFQTDPEFLLANGGPGTPTAPNPLFQTTAIPGTGPYEITKVSTNAYVEFQKNPEYWGRNLTDAQIASNPILDPGHFQTILVRYVPADTSRYIDLLEGGSQISVVSGSNLQQAEQNPNLRALSFNSSSQVMMGMNTQVFPTNITDIRQAIVHAINYSQVIDEAIYGDGVQYVGPNTPIYGQFYDPGNYSPYQYNLTQVEDDLTSAGYPNGTGLPALTLVIDSFGTDWEEPAAEVIQANLAQVGITVNIQVDATPTFEQNIDGLSYNQSLADPTGHPDMTFDTYAGYAPDYISPADFFTSFVSKYSPWSNYAIYDSPDADNAINLVTQTSNQTELLQAFAAAQGQIYQDAPYAWLFVAKLPLIDGTDVYNTTAVGSFYMDPNLFGVSDIPMLNTITP